MINSIKGYIVLMRPRQWVKNLLILFPPFFGGKLFEPSVITTLVLSFVSFSLASSGGYVINDIIDRNADQHHLTKRNRPIAKGDIPVAIAVTLAVGLYIAAILLSSAISRHFEGYIILYIVITFLYTIFLKHIILVDIFVISFGFLLRVLAGGEAFNIIITGWLFLTVFLVALLLSSGKRLGELIILSDDAAHHRRNLSQYTTSFLEGILWFSASATLVTYALYTLEHKGGLFYTVPLTVFGLLRYIYIVKQGKGDPTEALLMDGQILGVGIIWVVALAIIIYQ